MDFRILGPVEAYAGGQPVPLAGQRQRALLAYLLLHANEAVSGDRLLEELWATPPRGGLAALQTQISRLRKLVGDRIVTTASGYVLRVEPGELDLERFRSLLGEAGATADPAARAKTLRAADALWRGVPLDGLDVPFAAGEAAALEELRLAALEDRVEADLAHGRSGELVSELSALVARHPLRERLRGHLILALYRSGRQAEALEAYQATRRMLDEELGLEPGPALKELERAILRQDPAIDAVAPPPGPPIERRKRRRVLVVGLVALVLLGLGLGVPFALVGGSHTVASPPVVVRRTAPAAPRPHVAKHMRRPRRIVHHQSAARVKKPVANVHVAAPAPKPKPVVVVRRQRPVKKSTPHVTTTTAVRATATKPRIVTISDDFSGDQIDGTIWYQIYQGSGWTLTQPAGHLEFSFPPGTAPGGEWNNYGGHVGTLCKFPGDFDARVDFTLVQWPPANGIAVSLWSFFQPNNEGWEAWRQSSPQWGEQFGAYLGSGHGTGVTLDDSTGTLRLVRKNGLVTAYFLHKGQWLSLGSNENRRTTAIAVGAGSAQDPPTLTDQVVVEFDNFTITATSPICPAGAQGAG